MIDRLKSWWKEAHGTRERTWAGHWAQGFGFFLVGSLRSYDLGAGLALGAFLHREGSDFLSACAAVGFRQAVRKKLLDGIGDLVFAVLGAFTAFLLVSAGFVPALGAALGSVAGGWIMSKGTEA